MLDRQGADSQTKLLQNMRMAQRHVGRQVYAEFFPAEASDERTGRQIADQEPPQIRQDGIPGTVTMGVVDRL